MFFRKRKPREAGGASDGDAGAAPLPTEPGEEASGDLAATSTQFLTGDSGVDRRTVQVLLEAIARVSESRDLESLLGDIVDRSVEVTNAERGMLLMRDDDGELTVRVARARGGKPLEGDLRFSTSVAKKVLEGLQAVRATVQSESEALDLGRSVYDLKLRAVMCVPLVRGEMPAEGPALGVLYVDSRAATRQFSQRDLGLFAALAQHISIALENARLHLDSIEKVRLEQSLEIASAIQQDLMPNVPEGVVGWELHGWYRPAERTGGDYYDFVKTGDGRMAFAVGDVTGHGIGPALITASAQASMRSYLRLLSSAGEVVTMLNQDICDRVEDGRFITLYLAILGDDGTIQQLNAGHAEPMLWRKASGEIETFVKDGPALGMIEDEVYESGEPIRMETGDVLAVYTDGLTEARSRSDREAFFGEEGVREALASAAAEGLSAKDVTTRIVEAVLDACEGEREDDMTLVVVRKR